MFHPKGPSFLELARQALSSTERGYDLLAPKFEYTPFRTPDPVLAAAMAQLAASGAIDSALDLCCGTGAAIPFLRPLCRVAVVGVDVSAGMLSEARRRLAEGSGPPVFLVRAHALRLPFAEAFDLVTCFGALGHFPGASERAFVDAVRAALKPGGRLAFVTARLPRVGSRRWLFARSFNAAMRVRNALRQPPFVMYYLTFALPAIRRTLEEAGYAVEERTAPFGPPCDECRLVIARRVR